MATAQDRQYGPTRGVVPTAWGECVTTFESTFHQLAPYIGKLKSVIARDLVERYSKPSDLVIDPFSGSGTIALEAASAGRRVIASDTSPYAETLSLAKLTAPRSYDDADRIAREMLEAAENNARSIDLRRVPRWVRSYFQPRTLKEAIAFARECRSQQNHFLLACLLGILHHQRPGFLSYPCSHLVPYLRDRKYPRKQFPEMYTYRPLRERILSKIRRAYRRPVAPSSEAAFYRISVEELELPTPFDAMITSPPYMNALDYARDNRLRLWFIDESTMPFNDRLNNGVSAFRRQIAAVALLNEIGLAKGGNCVLVVGESVRRNQHVHPAKHVIELFAQYAPSLVLKDAFSDWIPDVRRSRRYYRGVKTERFLAFQKVSTR